MSNINPKYIEEYIRSILPEKSEYLMELEQYAKINHVPIIHPEVVQLLTVLLRIKKPNNILEIGTAIGYSALIMAESTDPNTKITTIEKRKDMVEMAKENIDNANLNEKIKIIQGRAEDILPNLNTKYDFIFLDAAKGHYLDFFKNCMPLLNKDGVVVSDNVLYKGMIASDKLVVRRKKTIVKRMRQYLKYITDLEGYETCVVPIGDGVAVTYREE